MNSELLTTGGTVFVIAYLCGASVAAIHALLTKSDPRSAMTWIALCWFFPLGGFILYWLFGINQLPKRSETRHRLSPDELLATPAIIKTGIFETLPLIGHALSGYPLAYGNDIQPLYNGEIAFPKMLEAIRHAKHSLWLSTYIFQSDAVGLEFVHALRDAAARGVCVKVLVDGIGEWYSWPHVTPILLQAGVNAARFLPPHLLPPSISLNCRNHRKMLLVDNSQAFVGGMNLGGREVAGTKGRRLTDIHFCLRGAVITQLAETFATDWQMVTNEKLATCFATPANGSALCRVITSGPDEAADKLLLIILGAISTAKQQILIMTPYFIPPPELVAALQAAALRGIEVSVVLPLQSNVRFVDWATLHWLPALVTRGVKIALQHPPFSHAKLFVVDQQYAQIGSANFDTRSLRLNFEIVVEVFDAKLGKELATYISTAQNDSLPLTLNSITHINPLIRIRNSLCWLVSPYL